MENLWLTTGIVKLHSFTFLEFHMALRLCQQKFVVIAREQRRGGLSIPTLTSSAPVGQQMIPPAVNMMLLLLLLLSFTVSYS